MRLDIATTGLIAELGAVLGGAPWPRAELYEPHGSLDWVVDFIVWPVVGCALVALAILVLMKKRRPRTKRNRWIDDSPSNFQSQIRSICRDLGLVYDSTQQDWGVENSDHTRIDEFVRYCQSHTFSHCIIREELGYLILESINDALESGTEFDAVAAASLLRSADAEVRKVVDYYLGMGASGGEFGLINTWLIDHKVCEDGAQRLG